MKKLNQVYFIFLLFIFPSLLRAQPFIDVVNAGFQEFNSVYTDTAASKCNIRNYNLNLFYPKVFKNENTFLMRLAAEELTSSIGDSHYSLYAFSAQLGFQFVSKSKKWKTMMIAIPKISSDLQDDLSKDMQYGGIALFTRVIHDSLKLKFGLYYNREFFGNFFIPLVGIDWKASKHISIYGILPNNMRVEYNTGDGFFFGAGFKNYQRSYRLFKGFDNDFVRVRETQLKVFGEFFVVKKLLFFAEAGYALQYSFIQLDEVNVEEVHSDHPVYTPVENGFIFNLGLAYRVRMD